MKNERQVASCITNVRIAVWGSWALSLEEWGEIRVSQSLGGKNWRFYPDAFPFLGKTGETGPVLGLSEVESSPWLPLTHLAHALRAGLPGVCVWVCVCVCVCSCRDSSWGFCLPLCTNENVYRLCNLTSCLKAREGANSSVGAPWAIGWVTLAIDCWMQWT